jgi:DNA adenine methylase
MNTIVEPVEKAKSVVALITMCKARGIKGYSNKSASELEAMLKAGVQNKSPLRYPGGKTRAVKTLEKYVHTYYPTCKTVLSPFFGGGSFELALHDKGYKVYGNDLFKPLYTFWKQTQDCGGLDLLVKSVRAKMPVTKDSFSLMRESIANLTNPLDIATVYYIINRTSFSGATFCGGFSSQAATGRLNDASLKTLASIKTGSIVFSNLDYAVFLDTHPESVDDSDDVLIYADPPYYISSYIYGKDGDLHESFNHPAFAAKIKCRKNWILSYNDCHYIRDLYKDCRIFSESWSYGMNSSKNSSEIIILPPCVT